MMLLLRSPLVVVAAVSVVVAQADHNLTGASVDLINAIIDSVVVHCWSRESPLGSSASLLPGLSFCWGFHPNIFNTPCSNATFCGRSCSYKVCPYNAFMVDSDYGAAESWEFYQSWLPRSNPEVQFQNEGL